MEKRRIVLVDDHVIVRNGLKELIEKLGDYSVMAQFDSGTAFLDWMNDFYTAVYRKTGGTPNPRFDPTDNVDGCYYNYPDSDLNLSGGLEGALQLYFGQNLPRLKEVKKHWDPTNYFNSFQSIPVE